MMWTPGLCELVMNKERSTGKFHAVWFFCSLPIAATYKLGSETSKLLPSSPSYAELEYRQLVSIKKKLKANVVLYDFTHYYIGTMGQADVFCNYQYNMYV